MSYILLIDDDPEEINYHLRVLRNLKYEPLVANDLVAATELFGRHRHELAGIVLDGVVGNRIEYTFAFIRDVIVGSGYDGICIAASSNSDYRRRMKEIGCSHQAEKSEAVQTLLALLKAS